jgi:putative thioredoxin
VIFDVDEAGFVERVVERSREVPVVVDFWADWCGPCKALTPALERAAGAREGKVDLAKVDVDRNPGLAQTFRVQGIPSVKAFRDERVVNEFVGALPPPEVERFFDGLVPSEADELVRQASQDGDDAALRRALELDPSHAEAARALGRLLLRRGETAEALEVLEPFQSDFVAAGLAARARLEQDGDGLRPAFEAWDRGDYETALELFQEALATEEDGARRDSIRQAMVAIFNELGPDDELARRHRRRLAAALY